MKFQECSEFISGYFILKSGSMIHAHDYDREMSGRTCGRTMTMTMTMMVLFSHVTQYKGIEENQGFTNSKNTNEQINIT